MKIFVIFTGGTIGSCVSDGWIAPHLSAAHKLLQGYKDASQKGITFDTAEPYTILSENLQAEHINMLTDEIEKGIRLGYEGIIVAHGTDTLQYSAAATAFCLGCDCPPVVFVSANFTLEDERSNGYANFEAAVEFILSGMGKGVYISYQNQPGGKVDIHSAARALSHPELGHELFSLGEAPFAEYEQGVICCPLSYAAGKSGRCRRADFTDDPKILTVTASPAENYRYNLDCVKGIVLVPYHSGTLATDSPLFANFCRDAKKRNIPMFLADAPRGVTYESMKLCDNLGIITLPPISRVALLMKLWLGISLGAELVSFVKTPLVGEFLD